MPTRSIQTVSRRFSREIIDTLMSLLALEMLSPAPEFYLVSAWITDVEILENHFGQYRALLPETSGTEVRLSTLLNALADRGAKVFVAMRMDRINDDFAARLRVPPISLVQPDELHLKMLITEHFVWDGSMNFTFKGIYKNPESVNLFIDHEMVSTKLLEVKRLFQEKRA